MSSDSEQDEICPVCCTELDLTDRSIQYCGCGFQMCLWCYNRILEEARKENLPARCPNCRSDYDQNKIQMQHIDAEELEQEKRKLREKDRPKGTAGGKQSRANLANIRVVQPNLVYAVGLGLEICHEEVLRDPEFFGQFGKAVKISVNRNNQYASALAKHGPTGSAYVTFKKPEDALRCIKLIDGALWRGKPVKACFGTTKYCNAFLKGVPCNNPECLYLHELADEADCLTKEEVAAGLLPARFLAMGATNTFKPRLTINVIPNATTAAAQAAAAAAAAAGGTSAAIAAAAAAAGGISRTHSQHANASNGPRVITIPASSVLRRDSQDGGPNGVWDSPQHPHAMMGASGNMLVGGPSSYGAPPVPIGGGLPQAPAPKGVWASAVASGGPPPPSGGGLILPTASGSLPPPPSDKTEWPTLADGGDEAGPGRPPPVSRVPSGGATMAEQLARSQSGDVNKAKQGRKLLPLASPAKLKPLGKAVVQRAASPAPDAAMQGSTAGINGNGSSSGNGLLEGSLAGLSLSKAADGGQDTTVPPPVGGRVIAPPPGFGASSQAAAMAALRPKKVPPPPGFGGPAAAGSAMSSQQQLGGGSFSPFGGGAPLVSSSLFDSSTAASSNAAATIGPPPGLPPVSRRQKSRFAFAQSEEDHNNAGRLHEQQQQQQQQSAPMNAGGGLAGPSLWLGGGSQPAAQQQQQLPSQQDTNAFFKSLFPGATVNVAVGSSPAGGMSPLAAGGHGGGAYSGGAHEQQQVSPGYNPLSDMFSSQQQAQQQGSTPPGGGSGLPPGLALLRQLQGSTTQPGAPPGFGLQL